MAPAPQTLPIELIIIILQHAYYKDSQSREPDYVTLASASLVGKAWTFPAQSLLFRYVTHEKSIRFRSFVHTTEHNDHAKNLLQHVRLLNIGLGSNSESPSDFVADQIPLLLRRCTRIYGLMLQIRTTISFEASTFQALKELADRSTIYLRSLEILTCTAQCPILYQLLSLFPTIRFLSLQCEISGMIPSIIQPQFSLTELKLTRYLPPVALTWILANSSGTLRIVSIPEPLSNESIAILNNHAASIRSLRLMVQSRATADFIRSCQSLVDLTILNLPTFVTLEDPPPSLQCLTVSNLVRSRILARIITMIKNLPSLRKVTCDNASDPHFSELQTVCDARGIEVSVAYLPYLWRKEEPIDVRRWPRCRSISDFGLMN